MTDLSASLLGLRDVKYMGRLAVTGTREALIALKKYGLGLGITFENLDKKEDK